MDNYISMSDINDILTLFRKFNKRNPSVLILGEFEYNHVLLLDHSNNLERKNGHELLKECFGLEIEKIDKESFIWVK